VNLTRVPCALGLLGLLALAGCQRGFFKAHGYVASSGGALGDWRSKPLACSRDPFDGKPRGSTASIATLIWEDPSVHDPMRDQDRPRAPDAPLRLELGRDGDGFSAGLTTVKTEGTRIVSADCADLSVQTWDQGPVVPRARGSLAGHLRMDCQVHGSHVTADLEFERCEF
jgi:hypothetical protein